MTVRLGTVPDDHPFLTAVLPAGVDHVRFADPGGAAWSPSPLLDPDRVAGLARDLDVVHVHFGFESVPAEGLAAWARAVRTAGAALVLTVHDLRNPHHERPAEHDAQLSALIPAADAVVTLTPGAAGEIARRWNRRATVLAHPPLAGTRPHRPARGTADGPLIGIHLKSLRRNVVDPAPIVAAAAAAATELGGRLRVDVHPDVAEAAELEAVRALAATGALDWVVHERFDDAGLERYLAGLDLSVLPYRFGTHSGWLELCRELGTSVIAPDCGYFAEQWPSVELYRNNEAAGLDANSLRTAIARAARRRATDRPRAERASDRARRLSCARAQHAELYRSVLAG